MLECVVTEREGEVFVLAEGRGGGRLFVQAKTTVAPLSADPPVELLEVVQECAEVCGHI